MRGEADRITGCLRARVLDTHLRAVYWLRHKNPSKFLSINDLWDIGAGLARDAPRLLRSEIGI